MKNLESLAVKAAVVALGVVAAGYVMSYLSDIKVVADARKGFTG